MDVTAYIRELLFGNDCVIVPGFGAFIGNYTPAQIDSSSGTFYPPSKKISFNRSLNHNDGLLAGRISASSGMNFADAKSLVEEFISGVRKKLERGEKVIFDNIGSFVNNQEGSLQFEPDKNANYLLDSYGLEPFHCVPVAGFEIRKHNLRNADKDPVRQAAIRRALWRAAIIVPLLGLVVAVPLKTNLFKGKVESTTLNPLVNAEFESNRKALDESNKINIPAETKTTTPEIKKPAVTENIPEVKPHAGSYIVITGSFKSKENADTQVKMLTEEGFSPEILTSDNGFFRVCAIVCGDIQTATEKKDSIIKKFPGTWVWKK